MKTIMIWAIFVFSGPAFGATCTSMDQALADFNAGMGTSAEVAEVLLCNLETLRAAKTLCHSRVGLQKDIVRQLEIEVAMGETSLQWLDDAKQKLGKLEAACPN
jgi:hypothetical protein